MNGCLISSPCMSPAQQRGQWANPEKKQHSTSGGQPESYFPAWYSCGPPHVRLHNQCNDVRGASANPHTDPFTAAVRSLPEADSSDWNSVPRWMLQAKGAGPFGEGAPSSSSGRWWIKLHREGDSKYLSDVYCSCRSVFWSFQTLPNVTKKNNKHRRRFRQPVRGWCDMYTTRMQNNLRQVSNTPPR